MKILFIYSLELAISVEKPLYSYEFLQFGISHLSSFLKHNNHDTNLQILSRSFGKKNHSIISKKIKDYQPEIIGFYSVSTEYKFISGISRFIKTNYPDIFLIIGGPHSTLKPEEVSGDDFDAICIGEGERSILELANTLKNGESPSGIKNLWIKNNGAIEKNPLADFFQDIDLLPFADREMWEESVDYKPNLLEQNISILLGLGCPFNCTYCINHVLRKITGGNYIRHRSPQNIIKEIKLLHAKYPLEKSMFLELDSFNVNSKWATGLCDEIEKFNRSIDTPLSFRINIRIMQNTNLRSLFKTFKRANITSLNIGIESGSMRVREEVLKRKYSNRDILGIIDLAKKYEIDYNFFIMIGLPGETHKDFKESIKICRISQPKEIMEYIFYPYPGTDLYEYCKKNNLLNKVKDVKLERRQVAIELPDFTRTQEIRGYLWFHYNVYKGYRSRIKLILQVIIKMMRSSPFIILIFAKFFNSDLMIKLKKYLIRFYFK
ncbi:MAG: B12-binding domain-containing radical SAM protein [Actinomycetia bacterium]|nr:B12-binding domain-containing radical SAM protein [Actinomycetes bacterium]